jgi:dTDP-4-dehydrorhamnose 3,5-epimerase
MQVRTTSLPDVLVFVPTPQRDHRGFFTRTFDAAVADAHGVDPASFLQDSQSRSTLGTLRGLHTRAGRGEAKLVRCARGAIHDVVVDARPESHTFGRHETFRLDDEQFWHVYIPSATGSTGNTTLAKTAPCASTIPTSPSPGRSRSLSSAPETMAPARGPTWSKA